MRLRGLPFEAGRDEVRRFFEGMTAHPSYCPSTILHIRPTATSDLLQHPTYDSCLFLYYLGVRLRQFLGRALRLGRDSGPSAAARTG